MRVTFGRVSLLSLVLSAVIIAACGGGGGGGGGGGSSGDTPTLPDETPEAAALRLERLLTDSGYDVFFDEIHPAMDSWVSRDAFVACGERAGVPRIEFDQGNVVLVRDFADAVFDPETYIDARDEPKVVNLELRGQETSYVSLLVAKSEGRWKWFLEAAAIDAYRQGLCPGSG